jgi:hypothetical protein
MKTLTIMEGDRYSLESYGNGWGYTLREKASGLSVWLQDDDAAQFRDELDALELAHPRDTTDAILDALWSDFEYGSAATLA